MKNIYAQDPTFDESIKKNIFDLDHRENLTLDWGKIYPLGQPIEVVPGDNVHLKISAALHAMPLMFPTQTPMQFKTFAFYVPNRLVWDNFEDYITGVYDDYTKKPVHPYHSITNQSQFNKLLTTGSLGDYLGIPTEKYGTFGGLTTFTVHPNHDLSITSLGAESITELKDTPDPDDSSVHNVTGPIFTTGSVRLSIPEPTYLSLADGSQFQNLTPATFASGAPKPTVISNANLQYSSALGFYLEDTNSAPLRLTNNAITFNFRGSWIDSNYVSSTLYGGIDYFGVYLLEEYAGQWIMTSMVKYDDTKMEIDDQYHVTLLCDNANTFVDRYNACVRSGRKARIFVGAWWLTGHEFYDQCFLTSPTAGTAGYIGTSASAAAVASIATGTDLSTNPFCGANPAIALNAIPARAYECICRSYFLNDKVNPMLDSQNEPIYNTYNSRLGDGADDYEYDFFACNWELDQFTDSAPTPQFGSAPLIGLTVKPGNTATIHFAAEDVTGTSAFTQNGTLDANVQLDSNGLTITGINSYDRDLPDANIKWLSQQINYGISINDIRNVNSLQRFKERMQRRSYRYKDQIKNHFGVDVSNVEVDMPEYLGGEDFTIMVNKVNNTSAPMDNDGAPLGDYAGQASIMGEMDYTIDKFCPEHGLIMVVGYVVPRPCYPQALPRLFTKTTDKFNYFFPEFGKMGYIPVPNCELAPLQYYGDDLANNTDTVHGTFGYQRAWYEYMSMIDGAHGDFRTSLADYLAMRLFNQSPQLNGRFVQVYSDDINNIFSVDSPHKFLGFVDYDCKIERPIPRFAIPSLE